MNNIKQMGYIRFLDGLYGSHNKKTKVLLRDILRVLELVENFLESFGLIQLSEMHIDQFGMFMGTDVFRFSQNNVNNLLNKSIHELLYKPLGWSENGTSNLELSPRREYLIRVLGVTGYGLSDNIRLIRGKLPTINKKQLIESYKQLVKDVRNILNPSVKDEKHVTYNKQSYGLWGFNEAEIIHNEYTKMKKMKRNKEKIQKALYLKRLTNNVPGFPENIRKKLTANVLGRTPKKFNT